MQKISKGLLSASIKGLEKKSKIQVKVLQNKDSLHQHFARAIADEIKANNLSNCPTRLILPVGPILQYPILVEICNKESISWKNVHTFNMDDYCDWQGRALPEDHPLSFKNFMFSNLFKKLDPNIRIPQHQIHFPDPLHLDKTSQKIEKLGGIDTCYGGIGYHGHVAFNEPPISRWFSVSNQEFKDSLTRVVTLSPDSIVMNSIRNSGGNSVDFPPKGITLGMRDIISARRLRFYCPGGTWQRYIVRVACFGAQEVDYPITLLQDHPDYQLFVDEDTAAPPELSLF
jgi:glucosamine-6-phosphate deaminase